MLVVVVVEVPAPVSVVAVPVVVVVVELVESLFVAVVSELPLAQANKRAAVLRKRNVCFMFISLSWSRNRPASQRRCVRRKSGSVELKKLYHNQK